ncbi:MAG: penicillin-binding protein, partial [Bdellovibrionales bacterium]|nr:penicillin-binding protein [Bdellovibrionales bacterium]
SVHLQDGQPIYQVETEKAQSVLSPQVASELLDLMRETVASGTSRKSFRGFHRGKTAAIDAGGKTGSLTGTNPQGKYDWFVGYGVLENRKIALAALTINKKEWRIKSSVLARRAIETYLLPVNPP